VINTIAIAIGGTFVAFVTFASSAIGAPAGRTTATATAITWALTDPAAPASPVAMTPAPPAASPSPSPAAAPAEPAPAPTTQPRPEDNIPVVPAEAGGSPELTPAATPPLAPTPPPEAAPLAAPVIGESRPPAPADLQRESRDEVRNPGYLPGYRTQQSLFMSPYAPTVGALPGGVTPGFAAPMPLGQWTFRFSGFFTASLQGSLNRRRVTSEGQNGPVFHTPPQTLDEYGSFVGTSTMPGQWVALNFSYGNPVVSANISINTWNPSEPSTYYQIGSQYFINNAYLRFDIPALGEAKLRALVGYFYNYYGNLSQYGPGMYTQSLIGSPRGVGESVGGEYRLGPELSLIFEDGLMGSRNGKVPDGVAPTGGNSGASPAFPAAFIHHLHVGLLHAGERTIRGSLHWLTNWSQDDRSQQLVDNPVTHYVNEAHIPDGRIDVVGADVAVQDHAWGYLGAAASITRGANAASLKGLQTFGGDSGQSLADRWLGQVTGGTGKLYAAGINYTVSLGRALSTGAFSNERPDLVISAGAVIAYALMSTPVVEGTTSGITYSPEYDKFNKRVRYKFGVDALYTFKPWMAAGVRVDRVSPTSKDAGENFSVLAPRLVFRRGWNSHESITLLYAKWFYGPRSHSEASSLVPSDIGLDSQLVALNVNLYW
jgi:hypothetical protein